MPSVEKYIQAPDGTSIFVSIQGSGQTLVLCDGLGCDGFIWRYLEPMLAEHFQVIHWHYPGHGFSQMPCDGDKVGVGDLRDILKTVLDELGVEKAILFGHSLGVNVSLDFAVTYPQRTSALVLCCGSYADPIATFHDTELSEVVFEGLHFFAKRYPQVSRSVWRGILGSGLGFHLAKLSEINGDLLRPADMKPYFEHLAKMNVELYFHMVAKARGHSTEAQLSSIVQPTLIVAGENDTFTPCWLSQRMAQHIQHAQLHVVAQCTHVAPLEDHLVVNQSVKTFLQDSGFIKHGASRKTKKNPIKKKKARKTV